ncbi:MAG: hypothetical protein K0R00_4290 [Herbinix sp.]|nr:hypothetical protein [Herbinix sp.]
MYGIINTTVEPSICELAAFTITSTSNFVISPCHIDILSLNGKGDADKILEFLNLYIYHPHSLIPLLKKIIFMIDS